LETQEGIEEDTGLLLGPQLMGRTKQPVWSRCEQQVGWISSKKSRWAGLLDFFIISNEIA